MSSLTDDNALIGFDVPDSAAPAPNPFLHSASAANPVEAGAMATGSMQYDEAMQQLQSMFTETDREVIHAVLESNGGHLERTIDQLLAMSDPSAAAAQATGPSTTTTTAASTDMLPSDFLGGGGGGGGPINPETGLSQEEQDRMLAEMLQNELFIDELQNNEEFAAQLEQDRAAAYQAQGGRGAGAKSPSQEQPFSEKLKDMGEATKRKMRELALRFGGGGSKKGATANTAQYSSLPGTEDDSEVVAFDHDDRLNHRNRGARSSEYPPIQRQASSGSWGAGGESKKDR